MLHVSTKLLGGLQIGSRFAAGTLRACRPFDISRRDVPLIKCRARGFASASVSVEEKHRLTSIRLYRILQRSCRSFAVKTEEDPILVQPPLRATDWGRHVMYKPPSPTTTGELLRLFYMYVTNDEPESSSSEDTIDDWYSMVVDHMNETEIPPLTTMTCWTSTRQLREAIRIAFRVPYEIGHRNESSLHKWAIRAVQLLQEQQLMWRNSSVATTDEVRVTATSRCIGATTPTVVSSLSPSETAAILENKFRFAYRIRVENVSTTQHVQLLGRFWRIKELTPDGKEDDSIDDVVVDSPATGAVGQLPVLRPGQVFEYMSGTDLVNARGVMHGHFYMARVQQDTRSAKSGDHVEALTVDEKFEAEVAPFPLDASSVGRHN